MRACDGKEGASNLQDTASSSIIPVSVTAYQFSFYKAMKIRHDPSWRLGTIDLPSVPLNSLDPCENNFQPLSDSRCLEQLIFFFVRDREDAGKPVWEKCRILWRVAVCVDDALM